MVGLKLRGCLARVVVMVSLGLVGCDGPAPGLRAQSRMKPIKRAEPVTLIRENANERTLQDAVGEVVVPARPLRVLPMSFSTTDALIVLGVRPWAAPLHMSHGAGDFADYQRPYLKGVQSFSAFDAGLERVLAIGADLILADSGSQFSRAQLRQVAPTVVMRSGGFRNGDASLRLLDVATVLGLRPLAEAKLAQHAEKMAQARALLAGPRATETVAILRVHMKQFRLYGKDLGASDVIFDGLGFEPAALVRREVIDRDRAQSPLDEESLALLDADRIFLYVDPPAQGRSLALLRRNPVWQALPAVRAGRVHRLSSAVIWDTLLTEARVVDDVLEAYGQVRIFGT